MVDEQDDALIKDKQRQLDAETRLCEEPDVDELDMTGTIASSGLTNLDFEEMMSEYAGSLPKSPTNLEYITQYPNFVNDFEGSARSEHLSVTPIVADFPILPTMFNFFAYKSCHVTVLT